MIRYNKLFKFKFFSKLSHLLPNKNLLHLSTLLTTVCISTAVQSQPSAVEIQSPVVVKIMELLNQTPENVDMALEQVKTLFPTTQISRNGGTSYSVPSFNGLISKSSWHIHISADFKHNIFISFNNESVEDIDPEKRKKSCTSPDEISRHLEKTGWALYKYIDLSKDFHHGAFISYRYRKEKNEILAIYSPTKCLQDLSYITPPLED